MYSNQIKVLMKLDSTSARYFGGVFSCDKVPEMQENNKLFIIVNTAPSNHKGLHWVLLFKSPDYPNMIFFDSYAQHPQEYGKCLEKAVEHFSISTKCSNIYSLCNKVVQSNSSNVCGLYCLYVARELCKNKPINTILNKFSSNVKENDKKICIWFKNYCKSNLPKCIKTNQTCTSLSKWKA